MYCTFKSEKRCLMFSKVSNDGRGEHQSIQVLGLSPRLTPRDNLKSIGASQSKQKKQDTCKTMCAMNELCEYSLVSKPNNIDNI